MAKIQETKTGQSMITIPKQFMKATGWKKGTELLIQLDDEGNLLLKEIKLKKRNKK
jgi:antitoxin component of MazEF toxin-antitoxin module